MSEYSKKALLASLISELNYHTGLYDAGHPEWSDKQWDEKYFELVKLENELGIYLPDSPTQRISYTVVNELNKVEHNHKMMSLAKTKDWTEFVNYFKNKDVICMLKLDGLTCSLRYVDGKLVSAETRGNGEIGEDILHNALVVKNIPNKIDYYDELIIDGEIICTYKDFEPFSEDYKNPRNFASGSIRLLDSNECAKRNLTFVAWNIIKGFDDDNSFLNKLNKINNLGFTIVPYTSSFDLDAKDFLVDKAKELGYPIDGLVGRFDDVKYGEGLGSTAHHVNAAFAFKFYDEEYDTRLKYIEWSLGRTGQLTPVAVFEPIDDGESIIERASLHNVSVMRDIMGDCCYLGQKIKVFKSNMIIPQIKSAVKMQYGEVISLGGVTVDGCSSGVKCPYCGSEAQFKDNNGIITAWCVYENCAGQLLTKLDHYCSKKSFDIKGLSKATLEKLMDWGWLNEYADIYKLKDHEREWKNKPGFGAASVSNILNAIESSKNCSFESVISAFGIPLIGRTVAKDLSKRFKNYSDFRKAIEEDFNFMKFDGYGYEMHKALSNFDYTEMDNIVWNYLNIEYPKEEETSNSAAGVTFCITGKLKGGSRDWMKGIIESKGGKVVGSMSSKVNYLINNDNTSQSSKNVAAKKAGIPIITEDEFFKNF